MLSRANPSHQARMMLYAKFIDNACKAANVTNMMDLPQSIRDKCWIDAVFETSKFATNMHSGINIRNKQRG